MLTQCVCVYVCMYVCTQIGPYITDRDAEVLKHLTDVRYNILTEGERGFELTFHFSENKYFRNQVSDM